MSAEQHSDDDLIARATAAGQAIIDVFGQDAFFILAQFLMCDEDGRAALMRMAAELASPNMLRDQIYPDLTGSGERFA